MYHHMSAIYHLGYNKLFGDWLAFQVQAIVAALFAAVGFGAIIRLARAAENQQRFHGCITLFTWVLSGNCFVLLFVY